MFAKNSEPIPMSYKRAKHLLNPLRKFILSPTILADYLALKPNASVLELGCGPGYYSVEVAGRIPDGKLTLVDIQQEMLDMAKQRIDTFGISNINYIQANATALPFYSETFDVAYLISVLGEVPNREKCIRELQRVLRTEGLLSISEQYYDPHFIPMSELKEQIGDDFRLEKSFGSKRNYTANFRKI